MTDEKKPLTYALVAAAKGERPWSVEDDSFLIFYGKLVGYHFVALHDLGRTAEQADERMRWLRENKPDLVAELEADADRQPGEGA